MSVRKVWLVRGCPASRGHDRLVEGVGDEVIDDADVLALARV